MPKAEMFEVALWYIELTQKLFEKLFEITQSHPEPSCLR